MSNTTTRRFSKSVPALFLALAVLIVGIAGTATAAKLITGKQVKNESLTHKDVKNGSLKEADLRPGVKAKLNAPSVSGYEVVTESILVGSGSQETLFVACPLGKVVMSGGGQFDDTASATEIVSSAPQFVIRGDSLLFDDPKPGFADGWKLEAKHNSLNPNNLTAYAICVDPS
jgi:hypothetical protein